MTIMYADWSDGYAHPHEILDCVPEAPENAIMIHSNGNTTITKGSEKMMSAMLSTLWDGDYVTDDFAP